MKIYTRTGDTGETGLLGKVRVSKASPRIEAIGAIDELNAGIGIVRSALMVMLRPQPKHLKGPADPSQAQDDKLDRWLAHIQSRLFSTGAELAAPNGGHEDVTHADVTMIEQQIDLWQGALPELTQFILPGGSPTGAELHRARAICRRAERAVVALSQTDPDRPIRPELLRFLNRLSDALFAAARYVNHLHGAAETPWERKV